MELLMIRLPLISRLKRQKVRVYVLDTEGVALAGIPVSILNSQKQTFVVAESTREDGVATLMISNPEDIGIYYVVVRGELAEYYDARTLALADDGSDDWFCVLVPR